MKAGPEAAVDASPLPFRPRSTGSARFAAFCSKFIVTPKGTGARKAMKLRPWQVDLVGSVLDVEPRPRYPLRMVPSSGLIPRLREGSAKSGQQSASTLAGAVSGRLGGCRDACRAEPW